MANKAAHNNIAFQSLFDLDKIQAIQDSFAKATGVASIITDTEGNPITRPSNFSTFCKLIRKTEKGRANCMRSNAVIGKYNPEGPIVQPCLSGGLLDAGAGICVGGKHVANWLIGQVRNEDMDMQKILDYSEDIGVDVLQAGKALDQITVMSPEDFKNISYSLFLIANQLSDQAFQKTNQKRLASEKVSAEKLLKQKNKELQNAVDLLIDEIESKKKIEFELMKKNEYLETLHETSLGMFSRLDMTQVLEAIIVRASNLTRIPDGFIHIYDRSRNVLEIKAACGRYAKLKGIKLKPGEGIAGKVWESGEPFFTNDYQSWVGKSQKKQFEFVTAAIGAPLTSGSKIEGTIGLSHHEKGRKIGQDTLKILEQFAELAAIAIDNAKLFEELKSGLDKTLRLETERQQMEDRLRQSQKMEAVGTLAGGIAHDFNNILFPVIGFSQMIMHDLPEDSPVRDQLQVVLDGAERAKDLVKQILTFSRETEEDYKPLKPQLIIKEVLKLARASLPSNIKIINKITKDTGMVMADPTQIHQIIMNLITNALHAMEENGGELIVELDDVPLTEKNLPEPQMLCGHYVCLKITDTGCGMNTATIKRMYDPYFTTKETGKGTGLGLAVVHGIVKNLHGEIFVDSSPGKGTSFSVYLPKIIEKKGQNEMETLSITQLNGNEKILLVDDEIPILKIMKQILERFGYDVESYDKSNEAFSIFESTPYEFDAVITDMTMPGITGDKLVSKIKAIRPEIPVILCTGFSERIANSRTNESKPDKVLMKPAGKEQILTSIRMLLD